MNSESLTLGVVFCLTGKVCLSGGCVSRTVERWCCDTDRVKPKGSVDTVYLLFCSSLHFTWFYFWSLSSGIRKLEKNPWSNNKKLGGG